MCNYMIEQNRQCLLAKNKEICHIHKNMKPKTVKVFQNEYLDALKIIDLENKNSKLEKRVNKLLIFQDNQKVELTNLYKTIEKKNKALREKEEHILKLQNTINTMKDDYDSYQYIIKYERNKQELINKGVNIYNYYNDEFHKNRQIRNVLAHRIK